MDIDNTKMVIPMLLTASTTIDIDKAIERHKQVRDMIREAVNTLLKSFNKKEGLFYTTHEENGKTKTTSRDSAIVLTAIENVARDVMDRTPNDSMDADDR